VRDEQRWPCLEHAAVYRSLRPNEILQKMPSDEAAMTGASAELRGAPLPEGLANQIASVWAEDIQADDPQFTMENLFGIVRRELYGAPIEGREAFREHLLRTRLRLPLGRARVGPSEIQGSGVFATRRIAADELITLYPGDALRYYPTTDEGVGSQRNGVLFGHHLPDNLCDASAVMSDLRPYCYDVDGMYAVVGLPQLVQDPAYLGHMINDSARCQSREPRELERYRKEGVTKCNATFEGLLDAVVAVVASKPIAEGEEILVAYGAEYWLTLPEMMEVRPHGDGVGTGQGEADARDEAQDDPSMDKKKQRT